MAFSLSLSLSLFHSVSLYLYNVQMHVCAEYKRSLEPKIS